MKYQKTTLPNGLRVVTTPMPSLESVTIDIWVKVGSRHEEPNLSGISHFLEHIVLDGGKKYPTSAKIWNTIDSVGGAMNAGTSKEYTNYFVKLHKDHMRLGFDLLSDVLINTRFSLKDVKKERGVILDEIARKNDSPWGKVSKTFYEQMYTGHPLSREVIGTKEIISNMQKNDLEVYKNRHYVTDNIVISVAGGVEHDDVLVCVEEYFDTLPRNIKYKNDNVETSVQKPEERLKVIYKDNEQTKFLLGFPGFPYQHETRYAENILQTILGSGASSRLFMTVREKHALAYDIGADATHYQGAGHFAVDAGTDPKNAAKAIGLIIKELEKVTSSKTGKITKKEFQKAKSFIKGHLALSLENSKTVSSDAGYEELLTGKIETPDEYLEKIDAVQLEEVYAVAKQLFDFDKMVISLTGPHKDSKIFEKFVKL